MHRLAAAVLLALLLVPLAGAAGGTSFEQSVHEGVVEGSGSLAGMDYHGVQSGSITLAFQSAELEQAWQNRSVQTSLSDGSVTVPGVNDPERRRETLDGGTLHLTTNQRDAKLLVIAIGEASWDLQARGGTLSAPDAGTTEVRDGGPLKHSSDPLRRAVDGTGVWRSSAGATTTVAGDFWVSLFGWTAATDDGILFHTGRSNTQDVGLVQVEDFSKTWLRVTNGSMTMHFVEGAAMETYVHSPTITTVGTTTLTGLPTQPPRVMEGTTTLAVTASGDHLEAVVTEGGPAGGSRPSTTALATPEGSVWLWGGLTAVMFVGLFVFVALSARSVPMLEWRSYHALDRHRPRLASFWANLWTRRDPWDGHAWSARGEARMLMHHDRGAARDFTKAHALLPPEERAVNALHAARAHARVGHATQTAHWIGIVASLDLNVLLTAREEPDFARVWDHASVQRAVQQLLGGA